MRRSFPTSVLVPPPSRSQTAGVVPLGPTTNGRPLLMTPPRETSVPPLNSKKPWKLVRSNWSTSINPALRTFVPRRTSSAAVPRAFVVRNVPPSTTTRLLSPNESAPIWTPAVETTAALLTTKLLRVPSNPTVRVPALVQEDPASVTSTRLLPPAEPISANGLAIRPPPLTSSRFPLPPLPTVRNDETLPVDPDPVTTTLFLLLELDSPTDK